MSFATCVHYRGSAVVCKAGVDVEQLRDHNGRLPCATMRGITGELACDRRSMPSAVAAEPGRMVTAFQRLMSGLCPACGGEIAGEMIFNDNVLALPCRHVLRHAKD